MTQNFLPLPTVYELKTQDLILFPSEHVNRLQVDNCNSLALTFVPRRLNGYRQDIQNHLKAFRRALRPLVDEHGVGLVSIIYAHQTDSTEFRYIPKTLCNKMVKEAFSKASGEMLWLVVEQSLHFFNWPTVVPVLGMSTADEIPAFFFLQDFGFSVEEKFFGR